MGRQSDDGALVLRMELVVAGAKERVVMQGGVRVAGGAVPLCSL